MKLDSYPLLYLDKLIDLFTMQSLTGRRKLFALYFDINIDYVGKNPSLTSHHSLHRFLRTLLKFHGAFNAFI